MNQATILSVLKQSFRAVLSDSDGRTTLAPLDFVTGLVFCFLSDTKSFGLEAIRRFLIGQYSISISKGAFWERLSGRRLKTQLYAVLGELMSRLTREVVAGQALLKALKVEGIYLLDSSTVTLWHGARQAYPGTWTTAAIKWHACFDLLSGQLRWFDLTPGTTNDRQCLPALASLKGKLILFDLGYWDYRLLMMIDAIGGYFLSRVKTNSAIRIQHVVSGLSERWVGEKLSAFKPKRKRNAIIEALGCVCYGKQSNVFRLIGFWNPAQKKYHWYITNLAVSAHLLYPLYRLRWTLELIFKSSKRSLNLDQRPASNNNNIIESLVLTSMIAHFGAAVVMQLGAKTLTSAQALAMSLQRAAHVLVQLATDFIDFIVLPDRNEDRLLGKIRLFAPELFEKNHQHRPTALARVNTLLVQDTSKHLQDMAA